MKNYSLKRKSFKFLVIVFSFSLFVFSCAGVWAGENLVTQLERTPLPHWTPPAVTIFTLENGLKVYALENHELPVVDMAVYFRAGESDTPKGKEGLAAIFSKSLVEGGTEQKSPEAVDDWLDDHGYEFESFVGQELTAFLFSGLSRHWQEALPFFWEAVATPAFAEPRVHLVRKQEIDSLKRALDLPEPIVQRTFLQTLYGKKSIWGRLVTEQSLKKVKPADLHRFHQQYFGMQNVIFGIAGDFRLAELKKMLGQLTKDLPRGHRHQHNWQPVPFAPTPQSKQIHKKVNQAVIAVGQQALPRFDPDTHAYELMQYILGGSGFTSRLTGDIRTEQGLAYSVYSYWQENPERGHFQVYAATRLDKKEEVLQRIREHLKRLEEKGDVTAKELREAKQAIVNRYAFQFETPFKIVLGRIRYDSLGYEPNYLVKYPERIQAVTLEQTNKVARQYLKPDALTTVIVAP